MKSFVVACVTALALVATPLVANAQDTSPVAVLVVGAERYEYYGGSFIWLYGQQSEPVEGGALRYRWTSNAAGTFWYWDETQQTYRQYADSALVKTKRVLGYFPAGTTTTCTLAVTDLEDPSLTSTDSEPVAVAGDLEESSRWLVVAYRPWAQGLGTLADETMMAASSLPNQNEDFKTAKAATKTARDYEIFCRTMRYDFMGDNYDEIVMKYYLAARQVQIEHHEGVAFHVYFGLRSKKWNKTVTDAASLAIDRAVAAVEGGRLDLETGTDRVDPVTE